MAQEQRFDSIAWHAQPAGVIAAADSGAVAAGKRNA
jgi:hypothetical protein